VDPDVLSHAFQNRPANYISVLGHQLKLVISAQKWQFSVDVPVSGPPLSPSLSHPFPLPLLVTSSILHWQVKGESGTRLYISISLPLIFIACMQFWLLSNRQKSHFKTFPCKYQSSNIKQWSMLWQCRCSCDYNFKSLPKCLSKHIGSVMSFSTMGVCSLDL